MYTEKTINLLENENIETLFKVEPPLESLEEKGYFGFIGVVLRDKVKDKIQCHMCGEWVSFMGSHVKKHKLRLIEYRKKFGLPLSFPLCSLAFSKAISKSAQSEERKQRCRDISKISAKKANIASHKARGNWMYGFKNPARDNMYACCKEQLRKRYEIVADIIGKNPGYKEIALYDKSLYSAISRRYGTLNKFREECGYEINKHHAPIETIQIISKIIDYFNQHKRPPTSAYFRTGTPTMTAIYNHFGSFKRALHCAGIEEAIIGA